MAPKDPKDSKPQVSPEAKAAIARVIAALRKLPPGERLAQIRRLKAEAQRKIEAMHAQPHEPAAGTMDPSQEIVRDPVTGKRVRRHLLEASEKQREFLMSPDRLTRRVF